MNMVNLFNLGAVEKSSKPITTVKDKGQAKKEFDKVFQDLRKQEVAPKQKSNNQHEPKSINKLGHLVENAVKVIQHETKNFKETNASTSHQKNEVDDTTTKINELVGLLIQLQQSLQALNQSSSNNEESGETGQTLVNEVITLLDGLKDLSQDLPLIQDMLGQFEKLNLNSSMPQKISVEEPSDLAVSTIQNQLAKMESSLEDLSKAISNLTTSFVNLQQTVNELTKSNQGNPLLQEVLTKLNDTKLQIEPAINLISKFPIMIPNLINRKTDLQDVEVAEVEYEGSQINPEGFEEGQVDVTKATTNQELGNMKLKLETEAKAVIDEKGLKARPDLELDGKSEYDQTNLSFASLIQSKQTNNLQEIQKLSQIQANAAKGLGDSVVDQIVQKASLMVKENFSEMKIQLTPHNLGKVELQISIERGIVVAKFAAESQQVKELIESNLTNLKQHLANQGLKVEQLTVNVGQQGFDQSNGNAPQQANFKPSAKRINPEDGEDYQGVLATEVKEVTRRYYSDNEVDYIA